MSSGQPLELAKSYDPRMNFNEKKKFTVVTGIANILPQTTIATGNSTSSVVHTFQTSDEFAFDRRVLCTWYVELTITGTSTVGKLLALGTNDGIRCMPISSMINNAQVSFNGKVVSTLLGDYIQALNRYEDLESIGDNSIAPSMPDQYQTYSDYTVYGANSNPLAYYGVGGVRIPRGGHPITVVSDDGTTAVVRFVVSEPLRVPPFTWSTGYDEPALIGINQVNVQLNLNDFSRFWCHAYSASSTITSITGQFYQNCALSYNLITPDMSVVIDRARNYFWSYSDIQRYITNAGSLAKGASTSVTCNAITLNCVPNRIYLYARQRSSDLLSTSTAWLNSDNMAVINSLNLTFNGVSGLLSSATQQQLFVMSRKNGLDLSWPQFAGFVGSPVCVNFGSDIGLGNQLLAVGSVGNFQLTVQANITNPITTTNTTPATTINYDFFVVIMSDGVMSSHNSSFNIFTGVLNKEDVASVIQNPYVPYVPYQRVRTLYGKGFFDSIGNFFRSAANKVKDVVVDKVVPFVKDTIIPRGLDAAQGYAASVNPALGNALAFGRQLAGVGVTGGAMSGGDVYGSAVTGGDVYGSAVTGGKRRGRPKGSKNKMRGGHIPTAEELIEFLQRDAE